MTFEDLIKRCRALEIAEERQLSEEYGEFVIYNEHITEWYKMFDEILGKPQKSLGAKPTKADLLLTEKYGGVYENQVLYKKDFNEGTLLAMLWPWGDGEHITLKIIVDKK